jgi:BMFP domain-containing protein YqiC
MVQTTNRFFDEVGRLMNDAAGVAQGVRREVETLFRTQAERFLSDMDLVKREEFEAVKDMARIAREENEALKLRLATLEAEVAKLGPGNAPLASPPVQESVNAPVNAPVDPPSYGNDASDGTSQGFMPQNPDRPAGPTGTF